MSTQVTYQSIHISTPRFNSVKYLIFVFYLFCCNLKEKDHIRRKNRYKKIIICEISIIILIWPKLGLLRPLQQKIKLPLLDGILHEITSALLLQIN